MVQPGVVVQKKVRPVQSGYIEGNFASAVRETTPALRATPPQEGNYKTRSNLIPLPWRGAARRRWGGSTPIAQVESFYINNHREAIP